MVQSPYMGADDRRLCGDAMMLQDASNPAAITHTLKEMIVAIRERDDGRIATRHPAVKLTIMKLMDMAGIPCDLDEYGKVYEQCKQLAG